MSSSCSGIPSNPDVDGIGIRLATYLQLFIGIATLAISPAEGIDSWWAVIITSLGLQIAAVADYKELSLYHALIVTWLTFPVFMVTFFYGFLSWGKKRILTEVMIGTAFHATLFAGFCMWVWATAPTFGANSECNDEIKFVLFAHLRPTGWFRYLALYIIGIWSFALAGTGISLTLLGFVMLLAKFNSTVRTWFASTPTPKWKHTPSLNATVAVLSAVNLFSLILAITMIELMVVANTGLVDNGSSQWTLGQIAAMLLVAGPLMSLWRIVRKEWKFGLRDLDTLDRRPAAALVARVLGRRWRSRLDPVRTSSDSSDEDESSRERLERSSTSFNEGQRVEAGLLHPPKKDEKDGSSIELEEMEG